MGYPVSSEVLVVDDTPANLQLLSGMLRERGYRVRSVPNGRLALGAIGSQPPDIILLDVNMPDLDGYQVCRRLKQDERLRNIPVLFISGLSEPLDKIEAFEAGGVDYVTKPFEIEEVKARIDTHLRLRRMQLELEQKNRTIEQSYAKLREMEQLRDALTQMIAHDMRSPLTGILGALQFLKDDLAGVLPNQSLADLERGMESVHNLVRMINDLLDVSRLEAGELPVQRSACDLRELARRAIAFLGAHARTRTIDISGLDGVSEVACDGELLGRVLVNLLDNALKFLPAGGVVRVRSTQEGGATRIEVSDTGPGIPKDAHCRIFERFGQVAQEPKARAHSSGLGLTFCRMAIEAHGGAIGVISEPGQGATFWFTLPRSSEAPAAAG
jgi:two-component system sensor histidine kinase/response regulator